MLKGMIETFFFSTKYQLQGYLFLKNLNHCRFSAGKFCFCCRYLKLICSSKTLRWKRKHEDITFMTNIFERMKNHTKTLVFVFCDNVSSGGNYKLCWKKTVWKKKVENCRITTFIRFWGWTGLRPSRTEQNWL